MPSSRGTLVVTGDPVADGLLNTDPLALLIGMLLDQQVSIEWAFAGPARLAERLGGELDAATIAAMDPEALVAVACEKPAIHRFPAVMARRIHELCVHVVEHYDGDAAAVWRRVRRAATLQERLAALPGFGPEKVQIFTAVLAKRFGRRPEGWEAIAGPFADDEPRSVADLDSAEALARLRARRREGKAKKDR